MAKLDPPTDDGQVVADVGPWTRDKHHVLWRYLDAFTTAMKNKWRSGLHYIDLFAGPGIERIRDTKELEWGSPLLAAQTKYSFSQLHLCEKNAKKFSALRTRLNQFPQPSSPQLIQGDANEAVCDVVKSIPERSLSLAFLDPYGSDLAFETLRKLSSHRADLIIFFPDVLDVARNWKREAEQQDSRLDRFMPPGIDWRSELANVPQGKVKETIRALYEQGLKTLDYPFIGEPERICAKGHPLYLLLFFSRHQLAIDLWRKISRKEADGQARLDFGDAPQ